MSRLRHILRLRLKTTTIMANFPFIGDYATRLTDYIPVIPISKKLYLQLNGKITAVKIIAWGTFGRTGKNPMIAYLLQTPNGTIEIESWKVNFFQSVDDCVEFINTQNYKLIYKPEQRNAVSVMADFGYQVRQQEVWVYEWDKAECRTWCHETKAKLWSDVDGIHVDVLMGDKNRIYYKTSSECTAANVSVLDFDDELPIPKGEYTVKREFTVKATSEEEAESIIDEAINKAYNEQFKLGD